MKPTRRWAFLGSEDVSLSPWRFLRTSRFFWTLVLVRLALGCSATSYYLSDLFIPFVNYFVESGFSDPWVYFHGLGKTNSFPYPPLMLYALSIPRMLLHPFLPAGTFTVTMGHLFAMRLSLFAADLAILFVLLQWFPQFRRKVLALYWASPIVMYILYWHGQLDIIPAAFLVLALDQIRRRQMAEGVALFAVSLCLKSHLWVLLPFLCVYVYQERRTPLTLVKVIALSLVTYLALLVPFGFTPQFSEMVFHTPERLRVFALQIPVGRTGSLLVLPMILAFFWLRFATYEKRNWDLFMLYCGITMSAFVLLAPPAPAYYSWSIPFLLYGLCRSETLSQVTYVGFSLAYIAYSLIAGTDFLGPPPDHWPGPLGAWLKQMPELSALVPSTVRDLVFSAMQASMALIVYQMYSFGIRSNEIYRFSRKHYCIGIAGDSGAGKSHLSGLMESVLGKDLCTVLAGDNYHRWPRGHEKWQSYTHLDAHANQIHVQFDDVMKLSQGETVVSRVYDHDTGKFVENQIVSPSRYILIEGLHALLLQDQSSLYALKIFVNPSEELRKHWKVRRDVHERGQSPAQVKRTLARRAPDRKRFILPQREHADIVISFRHPQRGEDRAGDELVLELMAKNELNWHDAVVALSAYRTLSVSHDPFVDIHWQKLVVSGKLSADAIRQIAFSVIPNFEELVGRPRFEENLDGCLQVICLLSLSHRLRMRRRTTDYGTSPIAVKAEGKQAA